MSLGSFARTAHSLKYACDKAAPFKGAAQSVDKHELKMI